MKTTTHFLSIQQLAALLQQLFGNSNKATAQYSFQPLPAYWAMNPVKGEMGIRTKND